MEKLYTEMEYLQACNQANQEDKIVTLVQKKVEYDVEVLEWNKKIIEVPTYDEEGNPIVDEDGNPVMEEIEVDDHDNPIMVEEEIINPMTGEKEIVTVQKHHTETRVKTVEEIEIVEDIDLRIRKLKSELDTLDLKSIRAIRANDTEYIQKYEEQAKAIREELAKL